MNIYILFNNPMALHMENVRLIRHFVVDLELAKQRILLKV